MSVEPDGTPDHTTPDSPHANLKHVASVSPNQSEPRGVCLHFLGSCALAHGFSRDEFLTQLFSPRSPPLLLPFLTHSTNQQKDPLASQPRRAPSVQANQSEQSRLSNVSPLVRGTARRVAALRRPLAVLVADVLDFPALHDAPLLRQLGLKRRTPVHLVLNKSDLLPTDALVC